MCVSVSILRMSRRSRRESTRTGKKEAGPAGQPVFAVERQAAAGHDHAQMRMACHGQPQVWSTAATLILAPRCLGSAAMVSVASAAALNNRS